MDESKDYTETKDFKRQMAEIVWANRIQTVALLLVFIWGVSSFRGLLKKFGQ